MIRCDAVADGNKNHVTLITLHGFEILDEQALFFWPKRFHFGPHTNFVDHIVHCIALLHRQAGDAERFVGIVPNVLSDCFGYSLGLNQIAACATSVVMPPRGPNERQSKFRSLNKWAGRKQQSAPVTLLIRKRDGCLLR